MYLLGHAVSLVEQMKKGSRGTMNKDHLEYTSSALHKVATIFQEKKGSIELLCELNTLYQYIKIPVVGSFASFAVYIL